MAEATTGNDITGATQSTGIISRISTSISNVRRMTADPAVQKSIMIDKSLSKINESLSVDTFADQLAFAKVT